MFLEQLLENKLTVFILILVNMSPLFFMVAYHWDLQALLVLYWSENLIIGGYTLLKMLLLPMEHPALHLSKLFSIPFFTVHYGGFCAVHGFFIMAFFSPETPSSLMGGGDEWFGPFVFISMLIAVIQSVAAYMPPAMEVPLILLVFSHGFSFLRNFIGRGEYYRTTTNVQMMAPYKRIVILHITIIALGFLIGAFGASVPMLGVLVLCKIALDILLHVKSHVA